VVKQNYKYLEEIAKLLVSLGVDQFQLAFVHPMGRAYKNFDLVVPKISEVSSFIKTGLDVGIKAKISIMVEAMPYCLMDGYENYISEKIIPFTEIRGKEFQNTSDVGFIRKKYGKTKFPQCKSCKYNNVCEGPWKEYAEKFGSEEFKAIN
jgi:radical SAM protein with 4Fe4S-binding SPASM domain